MSHRNKTKKEPRINIIATAAGLLFMLALFVLLVPHLGAIGASWSSVGGYLLYALIFLWHYRRLFAHIMPRMLAVTAVGVICAPLYLEMPPLPMGALWFALITAGQLLLLWILRVVDMKHFRQLLAALRSG